MTEPKDAAGATPPAKPSPEFVRNQTEQFMQLLKDLKSDQSPAAQRIRAALVATVEAYRDTPDQDQARTDLLARLVGLEASAADLLLNTVTQLQRRLYKEGKRIGTGSAPGKSIRAMLKALDALGEGLQQMVDAIAEGNQTLRESAQRRIDEAKQLLQAVGGRA